MSKLKLTELNPHFLGAGGEGVFRKGPNGELEPAPRREGVGITFDCPCGCDLPVYVDFENPIDGGPPLRNEKILWKRTGETVEDLTLAPSLQRVGGCGWHGYVENGTIRTV